MGVLEGPIEEVPRPVRANKSELIAPNVMSVALLFIASASIFHV
jgi:hypothetical protein